MTRAPAALRVTSGEHRSATPDSNRIGEPAALQHWLHDARSLEAGSLTNTPEDDNEPFVGDGIDRSPEDAPNAVHRSFRRVHPREFFGEEEWERRSRGPEPQPHEPEPEQPLPEPEETPRPGDNTGIVVVESARTLMLGSSTG